MDHILLITLVVGGTALLSVPLGRYMAWSMDPQAPNRWTALFGRIGGASAGALAGGLWAAGMEAAERIAISADAA